MWYDNTLPLQNVVLRILDGYPDGLSEYELMCELRGENEDSRAVFHNPFALFHAHFALYNALYNLRDQLALAFRNEVHIHAMRIQLLPYKEETSTDVAEVDTMREYYMDLQHMVTTTKEEVEEMLGNFWRGIYGKDARREALQVLGLDEPVTEEQIRKRYHELAMEHHPDRGGDVARFQQLGQALETLGYNR